MYEVTFELETITPLFMSGADRDNVELRPSAFKGMMRFWWRAVRADANTKKLWEKESTLFGAAEEEFGKSKVQVILDYDREVFGKFVRKISGLRSILSNYNGTKYLLYSVLLSQNRCFLDTGFRFRLILRSQDCSSLQGAVAALWCVVNLGGIGARARRGGGNLTVINVFPREIVEFDFQIKGGIDKILDWFQQNVKKIKRTIDAQGSHQSYSSLSAAQLFLFDSAPTWEAALNNIGHSFLQFRNRRSPDYHSVKNYLQHGTRPSTIEKAEFGLPILYQYRSLQGKRAVIEGSDSEKQRSASSLIFKALKTVEGSFYPMILHITKQQILAKRDRIRIRDISRGSRQQAVTVVPSNSQIVDKFLSSLKPTGRLAL